MTVKAKWDGPARMDQRLRTRTDTKKANLELRSQQKRPRMIGRCQDGPPASKAEELAAGEAGKVRVKNDSNRRKGGSPKTKNANSAMEGSTSLSFEYVSRGSVDYVVQQILRGLNEGRLVPGQKLIESDLAQRFSVARGTVREALKRLEAKGLVSASLHRSSRIQAFNRDEARDILEVTEHLVGFAARLAAERIARAEQVDILRQIVAAMVSCVEKNDTYEIFRLQNRYLTELVLLANNQALSSFVPRFDLSVIRAQFRSVFDLASVQQDIRPFEAGIEHILARDAEGAERTLRQYIKRIAVSAQAFPEEYFAI